MTAPQRPQPGGGAAATERLPGIPADILDAAAAFVEAHPLRIKTRAFLDRCSAATRAMFSYWEAAARGAPMPQRRSISPAEIKVFLPGVVIVGVQHDPVDFVYRLVGTRACEARGRDPTGERLYDQFHGPDPQTVIGHFEHVRRSRSFLYNGAPLRSRDGRYNADEILYLPLTVGGERVDQVLAFAHFRDTLRD